MNCYCGNQRAFEQCCELLINGNILAETPEQLMRSRYSAYATNSANYIYQTYAKSSQDNQSIQEISTWAAQTQWLKLTIKHSDKLENVDTNNLDTSNDATASLPTVEFSALYIHNKSFCLMSEKSRFIKEQNLWRYLDGDVAEHIEISPPKRNEPCICQSDKKFKHCCALKLI